MVTLHILQYSYSIMTGSATVCCCTDCINCTAVGGWKKCTNVMAVVTELVQKWCYSGTVCCAVQRKIAVRSFEINCLTQSDLWLQILSGWENQISATVKVSVYKQLHLNNCQPQFRSRHNFYIKTNSNSVINILSSAVTFETLFLTNVEVLEVYIRPYLMLIYFFSLNLYHMKNRVWFIYLKKLPQTINILRVSYKVSYVLRF